MQINEEIKNKLTVLIQQDRQIEAIKLIRDTYNLGLKESKDYVDSFDPNQRVFSTPEDTISSAAGNLEESRLIKDEKFAINELIALVQQGKKLEAIKIYKDATGRSLQQSKDYVDQLALSGSGITTSKSPVAIETRSNVKGNSAAAKGNRDTDISNLTDDLVKSSKSQQSKLIWPLLVLLIAMCLIYFFFMKG